ncbi:Maf-like protein [Wenzhouxiangella marina]|uniref:dTTP/UTP pyrophosphatase n=1 Tax=Wenzhouxiangella marina TaxID=1579979 RepID=A0A0K0XTI7_9GAMM|nr:Maf-like protein [Wenzhouxiangella marina]
MAADLILASGSPRRRELLSGFGLLFEVQAAEIDESVHPGEAARRYVQRMALEKAAAVARRQPDRAVLAADTSVVIDGRILGKPGTPEAARAMLEQLSGRAHQVMSAVALLVPGREPVEALSVTDVRFAELPAAWIERYVASGDPLDKAGAYGIQNDAGHWVRRIDGSYSGVVGLPLFETGELLRAAGLLRI